MEDYEAWKTYPEYRKWFNKLYVSELLGYHCGPCGVAPDRDGYYIIRPIYNLSGMSAGAQQKFIKAGDATQVPPGYFWCEWFEGTHYSATYLWVDPLGWKPKSCWTADKLDFKFFSWKRSDHFPSVPWQLFELASLPVINIEFIGDKVIEVHLRDTPDPDYDELIPIWEDDATNLIDIYESMGYSYIESFDNADGFIRPARIGFMVK